MLFLPPPPSYDALVARFGHRYKWFALFVVGVGMVASVLSTTSFAVAIPTLMRAFGLGQDQAQWVITSFMAAMTLFMLPTPWLLDRIGFRTCFLVAILVLALSSIAGSLAENFTFLVAARLVQGAAAGMIQPLGSVAVMRLFPVERQGWASGLLSFGIILAPAAAPTLGGLLLDSFGWQAIFLINLPFCLAAGTAAVFLLPQPREIHRRSFDWPGIALLCLATLSLIEGVASLQHSGPLAPRTLGTLVVAASALAAFVRHGLRAKAPLITLELFRDRSFAMGSLVSFAYGFGLYASTYLIPVFLQRTLGYSATAAGFALLPSGIALAVCIPLAGRLADRYSPQWLTMAGLALFGLSFFIYAFLGGRISYHEIMGAAVVGRIGLALIMPALSLATLRHLESRLIGQSSMVTGYMRQLGGVLGVAVVAVFVEWRESIYGITAPGVFTAFSQGFLLLAGVFLLALVAASRMKVPPAPGS